MVSPIKTTSQIKTDPHICVICGHEDCKPPNTETGTARGNTSRFSKVEFRLWKCPKCATIHSLDPVQMEDIYRDYPVNIHQSLDFFAKGRFKNLLSRLKKAGLKKDHKILDMGCGNGIFVQYLKLQGYLDSIGYDPYVKQFSKLDPDQLFDFVVANDVIEHVEDPKAFLLQTSSLLKATGILYVGTADSEDVKMYALENELMRLHLPFHRVLFTQQSLEKMARELPGFDIVASYRRSYMDTLLPFVNYRFLDEFNAELGHIIDLAFKPGAAKLILRKPKLLFYGYFGYFFPSAAEPAVVIRKS